MKTKKISFLRALFFAAVLFFTGNTANAQQQSANADADTEKQIIYAGNDGEMLLFDVFTRQFPGAEKLQILDQSGALVFEEKIPGYTPVRRYKIAKSEVDFSTISFRLSGRNFSFTQSFSVKYRVEETVEIRKVK